MLNQDALNYWKFTGYTEEDIERAFLDSADESLLMRVRLEEGNNINVALSDKVGNTGQGHFPVVIQFIEEVMVNTGGEWPKGSFLVWLEDSMQDGRRAKSSKVAPTFAFGRYRHDHSTLLMPDPAFLGAKGYVEELAGIKELNELIPWGEKKQTVFWRGSSSGYECESDELWMEAPRVKLGLLSKELDDPEKLDAYLSRVVPFQDTQKTKRIVDLGISRGHCPFSDFSKYRYQVDVDGYATAWISCYLKLALNSALLKVESPRVQWYFDRLAPWKNYIPLESNLSDLFDIIQWLPEHDDACQEMSHNASELIDSISYENEATIMRDQIEKVLACYRG